MSLSGGSRVVVSPWRGGGVVVSLCRSDGVAVSLWRCGGVAVSLMQGWWGGGEPMQRWWKGDGSHSNHLDYTVSPRLNQPVNNQTNKKHPGIMKYPC